MNSHTVSLRAPAPTPPIAPDAPQVRAVARRRLALDRNRVALLALLLITAGAYLWDLTASGYANSFYAAAVQAGTKSWKAFFFGSLDSSNFITVDKPPASLWVMALSGRIFGFSSASMLIPQVLEGVAAVGLLYAAVKRWFGAGAGLTAGALLAITPVSALMFRYNNPDALLVLLLVASAYCLVRALERAGTKWVLAAGTMIGFAFLAKMMQAFLVLPAFGLVYLVAAPTSLRRRALQTLAGAAAIVVSAGWWVAIVALWPAGSRPMIDGSPTNNIFNLIFGYNGLGRIFGASGPGGGGGGANFSGTTGILRLFNTEMGGQASWLLPAALIAMLVGLVAVRRSPRTNRTRAALLLWGGWLVISGLVFSLSSGVIHTYYTVALAPAIAALVAIGGKMLWDRRERLAARGIFAAVLLVTAGWSYVLLDRTPSWEPWLRPLIVAAAIAAVIALAVGTFRPALSRGLATVTAVLAVVACLAAPAAYSLQTITTVHTGSIPAAGPNTGGFGGGGGGFARGGGGFGGGGGGGRFAGGGGFPGRAAGVGSGSASAASPGAGGPPAGFGARGAGGSSAGAGGPGGGGQGQVTVSAALQQALQANSGSYRWVVATSGSQSAASLELATGGLPVMAIGGFNNQGGNISLQQFESYAAQHAIHYYIAGGGGGGGGGGAGNSSSAITSWVEQHFKQVTIGGQTMYDLTQSKA